MVRREHLRPLLRRQQVPQRALRLERHELALRRHVGRRGAPRRDAVAVERVRGRRRRGHGDKHALHAREPAAFHGRAGLNCWRACGPLGWWDWGGDANGGEGRYRRAGHDCPIGLFGGLDSCDGPVRVRRQVVVQMVPRPVRYGEDAVAACDLEGAHAAERAAVGGWVEEAVACGGWVKSGTEQRAEMTRPLR